jgi:hypothetical protein
MAAIRKASAGAAYAGVLIFVAAAFNIFAFLLFCIVAGLAERYY